MSQTLNSVPVVGIGVSRSIGFKLIEPVFENTPYYFTAFLDFISSPEPFRYNTHHLGVVLNALHPRPRALIVGNAVDPSVADGAEPVWMQFVETVLHNEEGNAEMTPTAFVAMPRTKFYNPGGIGNPIQGWEREMMDKLDLVFRPDLKSS